MRTFRIVLGVTALVGLVLLVANCSRKASAPTAPPTTTPVCSVGPATLDFGTVTVGYGNFVSFAIRNTGGGTLSGTAHLTAGDFHFASDSTYSLTAGDTMAIAIQFAPTHEGQQTAVISTTSGCQVHCTGTTPSAPSCQVSPGSLEFGTTTVGETKELAVTITNLGGGTLSGTLASPGGAFRVTGSPMYSIGAGQSTTLHVAFAPQRPGPYAASLVTGSTSCGALSCNGTGGLPALPLIANLDFGTVGMGQSVPLTFTVYGSSCGSQPYAVCADEESHDFVLVGAINDSVSVDCIKNYSINFPHTYTVYFNPNVADTVGGIVYLRCMQDQIDGTYRDFGYVLCTGVGYIIGGTPQCQLSATSIDFGTVIVGATLDRSATITNIGGGVLTGSVAPCEPFTIVGDPTISLGPGQSKVLTIRFAPPEHGHAYGCYLHLSDPLCPLLQVNGQGQ